MKHSYYQSPIGPLLIVVDNDGLRFIGFDQDTRTIAIGDDSEHDESATTEVTQQLQEYFAGHRREFQLKIAPDTTPFQSQVLQHLQGVGYGQTISYLTLAQRCGNAKASRAVGTACGRNPIPIVIPCHRVVGSNGKLTGFAGGLPTKQFLLELETQHKSD